MLRVWPIPPTAAVPLLVLSLNSCGTEAMGTDACRQIEQARCRKAAFCPALNVQGVTGVEECVQFARDRCLHGLAVVDPGPATVAPCVAEIEGASSCDSVLAPETLPACSFLVLLPQGPEDGGLEAPDAATQGGVDAEPAAPEAR